MDDSDHEQFISDILEHAAKRKYDPVKAREYYLRTRKLKGRKRKTVHEDEVPDKSPSGAKLVDFDGANGGRATYSDGSTFDGNGWDSDKASRARTSKARVEGLQNRLGSLRDSLSGVKDPAARSRVEKRLRLIERILELQQKRASRTTPKGS